MRSKADVSQLNLPLNLPINARFQARISCRKKTKRTKIIAPSVASVEQLLEICEQELERLEMVPNAKKVHAFAFVLVPVL